MHREIYQILGTIHQMFMEIQGFVDEGRITWFNRGRHIEKYIFDTAGRNPDLEEFQVAFMNTFNSDDEIGDVDIRDIYFQLTFHQYTFLPPNYQYHGMNLNLLNIYRREQRYLQG